MKRYVVTVWAPQEMFVHIILHNHSHVTSIKASRFLDKSHHCKTHESEVQQSTNSAKQQQKECFMLPSVRSKDKCYLLDSLHWLLSVFLCCRGHCSCDIQPALGALVGSCGGDERMEVDHWLCVGPNLCLTLLMNEATGTSWWRIYPRHCSHRLALKLST